MKKTKILMWSYAGMILIGGLIMSLTLATTVLSAPAKDEAAPFKIAIITSISGPAFGYGQRAIMGVKYKIEEEINKAGGINGHPVNLIIYDTETKADQAAMLVERAAINDKAFAILGPNSNTDVLAAFPTAKRIGIPAITMGGAIFGVCEQNAPWCFSSMVLINFVNETSTLLFDRYKVKSMAVIADARNYGLSVAGAGSLYTIAERKGVKVLHGKGKLDVETGWVDFTPQITQIKALAPDLIGSFLMPVDFAHFVISLKASGIDPKKVPVFGSFQTLPDFVEAAGQAAEGVYGAYDVDMGSTDPAQVTWVKKVTDYGKTITTDRGIYMVGLNTACGYDAAAFLCEAIKRTKITPSTPLQDARAKIRDELPKIKMKTYSTVEFRFSEGGGQYEKNRLVKPVFLVQVKDGKLVGVGTLSGEGIR